LGINLFLIITSVCCQK